MSPPGFSVNEKVLGLINKPDRERQMGKEEGYMREAQQRIFYMGYILSFYCNEGLIGVSSESGGHFVEEGDLRRRIEDPNSFSAKPKHPQTCVAYERRVSKGTLVYRSGKSFDVVFDLTGRTKDPDEIFDALWYHFKAVFGAINGASEIPEEDKEIDNSRE